MRLQIDTPQSQAAVDAVLLAERVYLSAVGAAVQAYNKDLGELFGWTANQFLASIEALANFPDANVREKAALQAVEYEELITQILRFVESDPGFKGRAALMQALKGRDAVQSHWREIGELTPVKDNEDENV